MSLTINESGDELAQTVDGITLPIDCSFAKVNGWIHGVDVHFEEVQALCLGMAAENDRLRAKLAAMESQELDTNYCALKSITDDQVRKVAKAFWRRIYAYRNDYGIELPDPMPVEFMAHMATALTWVDKPVPADKPARITEQDAREIISNFLQGSGNQLDDGDITHWLIREGGRTLLNKLSSDREQVPAVAVPDEWRGSLKEMVQAMRDYEMDVGEQAPEKHRRMMDTAESLLAAPSSSQQSARSPQHYAIEHAENMAVSGEQLMDYLDRKQNQMIISLLEMGGYITDGKLEEAREFVQTFHS